MAAIHLRTGSSVDLGDKKGKTILYFVDLSNPESVLACEYAYHILKEKLTWIVLKQTPQTKLEQEMLNKLQSLIAKVALLSGGDTNLEIVENIENAKVANYILCGGYLIDMLSYIVRYKSYVFTSPGGKYIRKFPIDILAFTNNITENITDNKNNTNNHVMVVKKNKTTYLKDAFNAISLNVANSKYFNASVTLDINNTPNGKFWREDELMQTLLKKYPIEPNQYLINSLMARELIKEHINTSLLKSKPYIHTKCQNYGLVLVDALTQELTCTSLDVDYVEYLIETITE